MNLINISTEDPKMARAIAANPNFTSSELYPAESDGHKYKPGDICVLTGLQSVDKVTGKRIEIDSLEKSERKDHVLATRVDNGEPVQLHILSVEVE